MHRPSFCPRGTPASVQVRRWPAWTSGVPGLPGRPPRGTASFPQAGIEGGELLLGVYWSVLGKGSRHPSSFRVLMVQTGEIWSL